jgi:hypothetical protein
MLNKQINCIAKPSSLCTCSEWAICILSFKQTIVGYVAPSKENFSRRILLWERRWPLLWVVMFLVDWHVMGVELTRLHPGWVRPACILAEMTGMYSGWVYPPSFAIWAELTDLWLGNLGWFYRPSESPYLLLGWVRPAFEIWAELTGLPFQFGLSWPACDWAELTGLPLK